MAEHDPKKIERPSSPVAKTLEHKSEQICGGLTEAKEMKQDHKELFEKYRDIIEPKVQAQFHVPKDFKLEAVKVRTQVVAGTNYYFHVRLPNNEFAHVKVFKPLGGHALEGTDRASHVTVEKESTKD